MERRVFSFGGLNEEIERIFDRSSDDPGANDGLGKMQQLCDFLKQSVPHFDWVGFYLTLPGDRMLVLGPFAGEPTEHTKIPFGRGICGQAAERRETFLVGDVASQTNYLACSVKVKAEIVVPIFRGNRVIGEIDIDSHTRDPFTGSDREFLEALAVRVAPLVPESFPE